MAGMVCESAMDDRPRAQARGRMTTKKALGLSLFHARLQVKTERDKREGAVIAVGLLDFLLASGVTFS